MVLLAYFETEPCNQSSHHRLLTLFTENEQYQDSECIGAVWLDTDASDVIVFSFTGQLNDNNDKLIFKASSPFFDHFGIRSGTAYNFRQINECPQLECVVFLLNNGISQIDQSLLSSRLLERPCGIGDEIIESCRVVDTFPVRQGIVTAKTNIVILPSDVFAHVESTAVVQSDHVSLQIQIVPVVTKSFQRRLRSFLENDDLFDCERTVFLTYLCLKRLGIPNGEYVKVKLGDKITLARAVCLNSTLGSQRSLAAMFGPAPCDVTAYVTPLMWFNMNRMPALLVQPSVRITIEPLSVDFTPHWASQFSLALINSPHYDYAGDYAQLLRSYFGIPRFLALGDVVGINKLDAECDYEEGIGVCGGDAVVYFMVTNIEVAGGSMGAWCHRDKTRLYQVGTANSFVPATLPDYYQSRFHPLWTSPRPPGFEPLIQDFESAIVPFLHQRSLRERVNPIFLISGPPSSGKSLIVSALGKSLNMTVFSVSCYDLISDTAAASEAKLKHVFAKVATYLPCIVHLKDVEVLFKGSEPLGNSDPRVLHTFVSSLSAINSAPHQEWAAILVMTSSKPEMIPTSVSTLVLQNVELEYPDEMNRLKILDSLLSSCAVHGGVHRSFIAQRTAGMVLGDLRALVDGAVRCAYERLRKFCKTSRAEADLRCAGPLVLNEDVLLALEVLQQAHAKSIGAPQIPEVQWDDVGGLEDAKREILDTIQLPLEHPELMDAGLRRSGVLLYGPPGTGKTLLAKAVATECSLNFLSVKGPELINMYVGQSEKNVRQVFARGRSAAPCVIFFDELDSLAPHRGRSGDSGGVMDRVVSQLLAEMDGLGTSGGEVFVIGATNRPDLLDPAILRPGRFDRLIYVGVPPDSHSKLKVLRALTRRFRFGQDVDLEAISEQCPISATGADLYALCCSAMMTAIRRHIELRESGATALGEDESVTVSREDFETALVNLKPSVSEKELDHYENIRSRIEAKS